MEQIKRTAVISIIIHKRKESAMKVNEILYKYGEYIVGRMGIPHGPDGTHVIAIIVSASTDVIGAITGKLGSIPDVEVSSAITKL
ncbi:MAG: CopG family transcriptional regulator [Deltaproteobacteria bacterium]|jgi:putative iron-only hydrogenase system regulator|nr:CopG family transcriptional regulator [Deltaproteobacteria bacterium]